MAIHPSPSLPLPPNLPKVALITGAARRLGAHIAHTLADAGFDIGLHYRQSANTPPQLAEQTAVALRAKGVRVALLQADLDISSEARNLISRCQEALGTVGVLINNAARFEFDRPESAEATSLQTHISSNLLAPVLLMRNFYAQAAYQTPALKSTKNEAKDAQGVIINLLDQKLQHLNPDFFSYTLSKAALEAATIMAAQAYAPRVRVLGISPGLTLDSPYMSAGQFEQLHQMAPLGQSSTANDIGLAVLYLLSAQAMTGTVLTVDGGQHLQGFAQDFSMMRA